MFVPWAKCERIPCRTKTNHVVDADQMLDGGFVAKASCLKPDPSFLYFDAKMSGRNVLWVDKEATY